MSVLSNIAMLPVLVPQALWVKFRAAQLSEAAGPRCGQCGKGPALRILVVGDSSGAGVGVAEQKDALVGRLVQHLSARFDVSWRLIARCGATTASLIDMLQETEAEPFDIAVIAIGVNDSKNGMRISQWEENYTRLLDLLKDRFGARSIFASGLPPLQYFPLLPEPLRSVLGRRAAQFDEVLRDVLHARDRTYYVPMEFPLDPALMASDGFHPGPKVYDEWALRVARLVLGDVEK